MKLKIAKSNVPGALPTKFLKFAAVQIVPFYTHLINCSFKWKVVPSIWKKGFITPVPKGKSEISLDNIRPITQTCVYSKIMEEFMFRRIYNQVIDKLNPAQYGAIKKLSTLYYLVSLFDFVLKALDKPNVHVIIVLLDLSKAFDLVDHNVLINCLKRLKVNSNDMEWVGDFLRGRSQCTKYNNKFSKPLPLNNGIPQGTKVAVLAFICLIDGILSEFYEKHGGSNNIMNAFVDDMCVAEAIKHDEIPHIQEYVEHLNSLMTIYKMCPNPNKSAVVIIDKTRECRFGNINITINNTTIPNVSESKLLGVMINSKVDWSDHINITATKASRKIFILRRLQCHGFNTGQLKIMYISHVRSILEYCCPLWSNYITKEQKFKLVQIEKRALSIIIGKYVSNSNYDFVSKSLQMCNLEERWKLLSLKFATATLKNRKYCSWLNEFQIIRKENHGRRYNKNVYNFRAVPSRLERYRKSTIPTLVRLLREKC